MEVTKFMLLRQGKSYWFLLDYIFYMLITLFYNLYFCFWDTGICDIKVKCKINKIYVIKGNYQLLAIANLLICHYLYMLNYFVIYVFVFFGDTIIDFGLTCYPCQV